MVVDFVKRAVHTQQWKMVGMLLLFTAFSVALITVRVIATGSIMYGFIVWNLFLAWIPYGISLLPILYRDKLNSLLILLPLVGLWLLFFPNAPYIITDLFHLKPRGFPLFYDLMLLSSAAWAGMLLGMVSLFNIQHLLTEKLGKGVAWLFSMGALVLCAFGVYLGRYLRWNSWDIISNPLSLASDILSILFHPFHYKGVYGVTIIFAAFLILGYLSLRLMAGQVKWRRNDWS